MVALIVRPWGLGYKSHCALPELSNLHFTTAAATPRVGEKGTNG